MRPYPDEILRSMQFSLDTYVIPHVDDKWGSYVAKVMRRMLVHLERRWQLEGPLLIEDTEDLRGLLTSLRDGMGDLQLGTADVAGDIVDLVTRALEQLSAPPDGYVSVPDLTEVNEVGREALVGVIEQLDRAGREEEDALAAVRGEIRAYLRRQVDRDNQLVEPTFMSFAPPEPGGKGKKQEGAAA